MADNDTQNKVGSDGATDTESIREILAANIMTYRHFRGMSRAEMAAELGVTTAAVGLYERGERTPSLEILGRLADILDTTVDVLIGHSNIEADNVREYRFDKATGFIESLGFIVNETSSGNVKIRLRVEGDMIFGNTDGVLSLDGVNDEGVVDIVTFSGRKAFVAFFEGVMRQICNADGIVGIVADSISHLRTTGRIFTPRLEILYGGGQEPLRYDGVPENLLIRRGL